MILEKKLSKEIEDKILTLAKTKSITEIMNELGLNYYITKKTLDKFKIKTPKAVKPTKLELEKRRLKAEAEKAESEFFEHDLYYSSKW